MAPATLRSLAAVIPQAQPNIRNTVEPHPNAISTCPLGLDPTGCTGLCRTGAVKGVVRNSCVVRCLILFDEKWLGAAGAPLEHVREYRKFVGKQA